MLIIMNYYAYLYVICVFIIILIYVFIKYKLIRPSIVGILNQANLKIIFNLKMLAFLCQPAIFAKSIMLHIQLGSQYPHLKLTVRHHNNIKQIILMLLLQVLKEGFQKLKYIDDLNALLKFLSRKRFYIKKRLCK